MGLTLLLVGLACIIAAIIGGGVKLAQLEIPKFSSGKRQALLGGFGAVLFLFGAAAELEPAAPGGDGGNDRAPETKAPDTQVTSAAALDPAPAGGGSVVPEKAEEREQEEEEQAAPPPRAKPSAFAGTWHDGQNNGIRFFENDGDFRFYAVSADGQHFWGPVQLSDRTIRWETPRIKCRTSLTGDGDALEGQCTDILNGLSGAVRLVRF